MVVRDLYFQNRHLAGKTIFFLTDLHFRSDCVIHFPWPLLHWRGVESIRREILAILKQHTPDYIIFGGDLATEAAQMPAAFQFLSELTAKRAKIAVPGNWEMSRKPWLPESVWRGEYERAGFVFLKNEGYTVEGIEFYGTDEAKTGKPQYRPKNAETAKTQIVISHSPDVADMFDFSDAALVLCGHTHGGQVRVPFYGAVATSSRSGKKYEGGLYHLKNRVPMLVSAGIGTTWFPVRAFCPPEAHFIHFTDSPC